jgi:DNA (cytosine-5)-methyltransferase 1
MGRFRFYEFFAGSGLARLGLGVAWACVWANDIDARKARIYAANFGAQELLVGDVNTVTAPLRSASHRRPSVAPAWGRW